MKTRALQAALSARQKLIDQKEEETLKRIEAAFSVPEIKRAHTEYLNARFAYGMGRIKDGAKVEAALDAYRAALAANGYDEHDLERRPICEKCGDKGVLNGELCDCIKPQYVEALAKECGVSLADGNRFDDLDPARATDPAQRADLEKIIAYLKIYAEKLPNVKYHTLVLLGGTGTGKTSLATALARAAIERGLSALVKSAYALNSLMLTCHTSPIFERNAIMRDVMSAELLIIDDLGSEQILRNVTVEYLLVLLEERRKNGLSTVITSNLSIAAIQARYQERVTSRLCDKRDSRVFVLKGDDLRI